TRRGRPSPSPATAPSRRRRPPTRLGLHHHSRYTAAMFGPQGKRGGVPVLATVMSCALIGLDGTPIAVEVDVGVGMPAFTIVGLPDASVQEAKERVRAAIRTS